MSKVINIGGRLHSTEQGNVLTGANEILDDTKGKKQNVVNSETDAELLRLEQSKQDNLTFDNAPTENSNNPVKSGGVYAADKALSDAIEAILLLIPSAASALNQLADKAFVNSSVSTATATFRGTYNVVTDLELAYDATHEQIAAKLGQIIATADNNDYSFVQIPVSATSTNIRRTERYKYNGTAWAFEYDLNTSGFTAAQWEAINSGITALLVAKLSDLPTATTLATMFAAKQNTLTFDSEPTALSTNPVTSGGIYTAVQTVATALTNYENSINALIPSEATDLNQLADKAYVLAKILDATPAFKGQFVTLAELQAVSSPKAGDLGIVRTKDNDGLDVFTFYQYLNNTWNVFFTLQYHHQTKPATTGTTGDYPYNGMGRVTLKKNMVNGVNTLTQDMFYKGEVGSRVPNTNTIFVIQYDFILGENITIPANCVLEFTGGSISANGVNNTIYGQNSSIVADNTANILSGISLYGTWKSLNGFNIFQVGANYIFKTIESAYLAAIRNGGGVIFIHEGIYDEAITQPNNSDSLDIHFIGESKETVTWKSSTKGYDYACFAGTGNLTFENIHFIKGTTPSLEVGDNGYALHFDYPGRSGRVVVDNCIIESYEEAAIGCGTQQDCIIEVRNCNLISYGQNDHGAFLYHTTATANKTGQQLILENNYLYATKALCAISIYNSANNTEDTHPIIRNNIVMTSLYGQYKTSQYWNEIVSLSILATGNSTMSFDVDKCLNNNHNKLNGETREIKPSYIRAVNPLYYSLYNNIIFGSYIELPATIIASYPINSAYAPPINLQFPCTIKSWDGSAWSTFTSGVLVIKTDGTIEIQTSITLDSSHYIDANFVYSIMPI